MILALAAYLVFGFVVVATIRICVNKGYPIFFGVALAVVGQVAARTIASIFVVLLTGVAPPLATIALAKPIVQVLTPMLGQPRLPRARQEYRRRIRIIRRRNDRTYFTASAGSIFFSCQ